MKPKLKPEVNRRDGRRPTHTRGTPEQSGARAGVHVVYKQIPIALACNLLDGTCQDASRIHGSVNRDLPEGLRAETASSWLDLPFTSVIELA